MIRVVRVSGHSMCPRYHPDDYVIVAWWPTSALAVGHDIVFRADPPGMMLKRIHAIGRDGIEIRGLNALSTDGSTLGPVQPRDVVGRVIAHIRKPRS